MRFFAYIAVFLCSGCANHYTASKNQPMATIIFSSSAPHKDGVMVQAFSDKKCGKNSAGTRVAYFFKDIFDDRAGAPKSVIAKQEFVFTFGSRSDTGTVATFCRLTRSFMPDTSATYRAHFVSTPQSCDVLVTKLQPGSTGQIEETPINVSIVEPVCFNDWNG